jgi:hypothetical protein
MGSLTSSRPVSLVPGVPRPSRRFSIRTVSPPKWTSACRSSPLVPANSIWSVRMLALPRHCFQSYGERSMLAWMFGGRSPVRRRRNAAGSQMPSWRQRLRQSITASMVSSNSPLSGQMVALPVARSAFSPVAMSKAKAGIFRTWSL